MKTKDKKRFGSAFDKLLKDPEFKKDYNKEFQELALSELLHAFMENDGKSVRKLAELADISPTTIQNIKSGKSDDMKLSNFLNIIKACGFEMRIVKEGTSKGESHLGTAG
ncbi:MAG: helix-turn-helix transcriptional regulator [Cytophagales bacterium]|nr:helix-turn-helix transcriptional regulator [Cytophagales bacterium]